MNLSDDQKEGLRLKIEGEGYELFSDAEYAKAELTQLSKEVEEMFGVKAATFKKLVSTHYKASIEEDNAKWEDFNSLYREVMDNG